MLNILNSRLSQTTSTTTATPLHLFQNVCTCKQSVIFIEKIKQLRENKNKESIQKYQQSMKLL